MDRQQKLGYKQKHQEQYYQNFIDSLNRSEETRRKYIKEFDSYVKYLKITDPNSLITEELLDSHQRIRQIENQIREYIKYLGKVKGWGYKAVLVARSSIFKFYEVNRVTLNRKYLNQFMPAQRKLRADKAYSHKQIEKLLLSADKRDKVMILLMASTGMRIGALSQLTIGNLAETHIEGYPSDSHIYRIVVYEAEKEEYYTFCTFECAAVIVEYLEFRANAGEDITDMKAPLLREKFNSKDKTTAKKPQFINHKTLHTAMYELLIKSGLRIRTKKEDTHSYETMESHGLRKFCITQMKNAKVDFNDREYLVGHKHSRGLDVNYDRTSEEDRLAEYMKAIELLTISPENRLRKQVAEQEHTIQVQMGVKDRQIQGLTKQMAIMKQHQKEQSEILKYLTPELLERIRKS